MAALKKNGKKLTAIEAKAKKDLIAMERAAKRAAQKEQGVFDGRFRVKVVKDKKKYSRKMKRKNEDIDPTAAS